MKLLEKEHSGHFHDAVEILTLACLLFGAWVAPRQGHTGFSGQALDSLRKAEAFCLRHEPEDVPMLPAGEAMIKTLLIVDRE